MFFPAGGESRHVVGAYRSLGAARVPSYFPGIASRSPVSMHEMFQSGDMFHRAAGL